MENFFFYQELRYIQLINNSVFFYNYFTAGFQSWRKVYEPDLV